MQQETVLPSPSPRSLFIIIGAGVLGKELGAALLNRGGAAPEDLVLCQRNVGKARLLREELPHTSVVATIDEAFSKARVHYGDAAAAGRPYERLVTLLTVKPQQFAATLAPLSEALAETSGWLEPTTPHTVVSCISGWRVESLRNSLSRHNEAPVIVRLMPTLLTNTPWASFGLLTTGVSPHAAQDVLALFERLGAVISVDTDDAIDTLTACMASGTGLIAHILYQMIQGAVRGGLTWNQAYDSILSVAEGTAAHLRDIHPREHPLRYVERVASSGGTTITALEAAKRARLDGALSEMLDAAIVRARELGSLVKTSEECIK